MSAAGGMCDHLGQLAVDDVRDRLRALLHHRQEQLGLVRLATLGEDGLTGGFFSEDGPLPW
ncbi:hypothetical protein [Nonomuraea fuscirosea]|uniref:hypothetical protein n=1 Tax=Nonomuraea fuscirosea TaxID=1291556 RepID=UPI003447D8B4